MQALEGDRKIFANMDYTAVWVRMHPCVENCILKAFATEEEMQARFTEVVRQARRIIQETCDKCGVAPHCCVCAVYCFLCSNGYYALGKMQMVLCAFVKAEMELMATAYAEAQRRKEAQSRQVVVFHAAPAGGSRTSRIVVGGAQAQQQSLVVNNHHYTGGDGQKEYLQSIEKKLDELLKRYGGQERARDGEPSAPDMGVEDLLAALKGVTAR